MPVVASTPQRVQTDSKEPTPADWAWLLENSEPAEWKPAPGEPLCSLSEWIDQQASYYASLDTACGYWLCGRLRRLAELARFFNAECGSQLNAREKDAEWDREAMIEARGYDRGVASSQPNLYR